jgi:hypothetical protein
MSKNLILGIAAGAAAVAVVGLILKRTGVLDNLISRIGHLADEIEDRFADLESFGMHDVIPKGEDKNVSKTLTANNN